MLVLRTFCCSLFAFAAAELCLADQTPVLEQVLATDKPTVVVFLGVECPLAKLYARRLSEMSDQYADRVRFVGLNPNSQDSAAEIDEFCRVHQIAFSFLPDDGQSLARQLKATRTPEAFLLSPAGAVLYRGRIDDQYQPGANRGRSTRKFLREAIEAVLAGQPVEIPITDAVGCLITFRPSVPVSVTDVTYCRDVAPILYSHCVKCHRAGQVAPFHLTSYDDAVAWSEMIAEVIRDGRMPPWGAAGPHGQFSNDPRLTADQKDTIFTWMEAEMPEGDPADLPQLPKLPSDGWLIQPDRIYSMSRPFTIPAEGVLEYQKFIIDPELKDERWIQAVQIRPGNHAVVHHAGVSLRPRGTDGHWRVGPLQDTLLAMYLPGQPVFRCPQGAAKRLPANCELVLEVHYVTLGSPQTDQTSIGIQWAHAAEVQRELATWVICETDYEIPAHAAEHPVSFGWTSDRDVWLHAVYPHMHLRGKSAEVLARYPDGKSEVLLNVPRYDFAWQHRYDLARPKHIPSGTELRMAAVFDNSAANPTNPDPSVVVRDGWRTTDEMCQTYFDVSIPHAQQHQGRHPRRTTLLLCGASVLALYCGLCFLKRQSLTPVSR
ncbi:MAG: redoxin domain-containing protein [Planctomycetota bacterium]|nr:redoxin domain-containing protein [Planctomycetota bacterium]